MTKESYLGDEVFVQLFQGINFIVQFELRSVYLTIRPAPEFFIEVKIFQRHFREVNLREERLLNGLRDRELSAR